MIVHNYAVIHRLVLDTDYLYMECAFKAPGYNEETFPFCIAFDISNNINIVNTKEGTIQSLVECKATYACCVPTQDGQFDLHFTSRLEEEPKKWFSYHHKMSFKRDMIAVMKRIGQVPNETLEDNFKMIEESKKT